MLILMTFLYHSVAFCTPGSNFTLRAPSHFSRSTEEFIKNQNGDGRYRSSTRNLTSSPLDTFEGVNVRWLGRKAIIDLDDKHVVMIKFAHQQDDGNYSPGDILMLEREARNMGELTFLPFVPILQEDGRFVYNFKGEIDGPLIKTKNRQGRYPAISFVASRDSEAYLIQRFPTNQFAYIKNATLCCAEQLGLLIAAKKYHSTLLPFTHRNDAWRWDFSTIGDFEIKPEDLIHSNLTLAGIIDFEHVFSIPDRVYTYAPLVILNKPFLHKVLLNRSLESWFGQQWSELCIAIIASGVMNKLKEEEILEIIELGLKRYYSSATGEVLENLLTRQDMIPIIGEMRELWSGGLMKIRTSDHAGMKLSASVRSLVNRFTQTKAFTSLIKTLHNEPPIIQSTLSIGSSEALRIGI